jgi:hypothetical protein
MSKPEVTYQIEAIFEQSYNDDERTDTTTVNMEHEDPFVAMSKLLDTFYGIPMLEFHCEQVLEDEDEDDDK